MHVLKSIAVLFLMLVFTDCSATPTPTLPPTELPSVPLQPTIDHPQTIPPNELNTIATQVPQSTKALPKESIITPSPTPTLQTIEEFRLEEFHPFALNYSTEKWTLARQKKSHTIALNHNVITGCIIREQGGTDV